MMKKKILLAAAVFVCAAAVTAYSANQSVSGSDLLKANAEALAGNESGNKKYTLVYTGQDCWVAVGQDKDPIRGRATICNPGEDYEHCINCAI